MRLVYDGLQRNPTLFGRTDVLKALGFATYISRSAIFGCWNGYCVRNGI